MFIIPLWNDLSKTWTLPVIHELGHKEPGRFNELKKRIDGINAMSLTERLTDLERHGIIERRVFPETPPRVEYSLAIKGKELHTVSYELAQWVKKWNKQEIISEPIRESARDPAK